MSGYVPVFQSIFTGTLHGRWPDIGLWMAIIALADKNGELDCTPEYISSVTGLAVKHVNACIARFLEPDPASRTTTNDGRRLELLDAARPWGWRIINHGKYREKARLAAKSASEVGSGKNAVRMADRRRPPETASDPLSDSYANTNTDKRKDSAAPPLGLDLQTWDRWERYRRETKMAIKPASRDAAMRKLASFGGNQAAVVEQSIAQSWRGLFPLGKAAIAVPKPFTWRPPPDEEDEEQRASGK